MKNFLLLILITFSFQIAFSQDKIYTKDKKELNVQILEKSDKNVKYIWIDQPYPVFSIKTNHIEKIEYSNGTIDLMGNQNPRRNNPFGLSAGFAYAMTEEGGIFYTTLDYFILPQVDIEVSIGTDTEDAYFALGSRFHLNADYSEKRFTPYTGLLFGSFYNYGFVQIPVGINYASKSGLNISFGLNEMLFTDHWQTTSMELRIGKRF